MLGFANGLPLRTLNHLVQPRSPIVERRWGLAVSSGIFIAGFLGLSILSATQDTLRDRFVPWTIALYLVAALGFFLAVWWNELHPIPWRWIIVIALVVRLLMLTTSPTLSDDVYRYLWEGHLLTEGVSPYDAPVNDPTLDRYETPIRSLVNNPTLSSPYLPAAHAVFGMGALVLPLKPIVIQLIMVGFELLAAAGLLALLKLTEIPRKRIILWVWNPLVIVEVAHGAHLDAMMVALSVAALVFTLDPRFGSSRRGLALAPIALALATLTRPIPGLLFVVLFWRWTWTQRMAYVTAVIGAIVPFGIWSGFGLGGEPADAGVFGSSRVYSQSFRFNSAIYQSLETWVSGRGLDDRGWNEPIALTRILVVAVFAIMLIEVWRRARTVDDPLGLLRLAAVPTAAYVLLTPVLHPWYVLMLLALVLFFTPARGESSTRWVDLLPWAWVTGTVVFSYLTYRDPTRFAELSWVRRFEWWPTWAMLFVLSTRHWRVRDAMNMR